MVPEGLWQKHKHRPTLDRAIELADKTFPKLEVNVARDGGDVVELLLYDVEEFRDSNHRIAHYNKWYDEIRFSKLVYTDD